MFKYGTTLPALAVMGALGLYLLPEARAQTAEDLDCNKCVEKQDLAKKAVVRSRIKKNAVNGAKVKDGSLTGEDLQDGTVGTADLNDGAVTFAKLAADAVFMTTTVVSPVGPTATDNCDQLQSALAGITDNDADNRYLIYVEPGIYDCGSTAVQMKAYIDIQGAGHNATLITGAIDGFVGVVQVASNSELRHLMVENTGGGETATAVSGGADNTTVSHVKARASGATTNIGLSIGGTSGPDTAVVTDVIAEAFGGATAQGVLLHEHGADLDNVVARARDAAANEGMRVTCTIGAFPLPRSTVRGSVLDGTIAGLAVEGTAFGLIPAACTSDIRIANTELIGLRGPTGNYQCFSSYDFSQAPPFALDTQCQD